MAAEQNERTVYTVAEFNRRLAGYIRRVREVWVEGELAELRAADAWKTVFLTLKDATTGATLSAQLPRHRFDQLTVKPGEGETVRVQGRPDVWEGRGQLVFRVTTIERAGIGDHLAALERLKLLLAAEGLFAVERKRPLPRFPRGVGLLTGADAAARGDVVAALRARFPATALVVCETRVQGAGAPVAIATGLTELGRQPDVDVVILARGGGSLEDLLPFSDEQVVRAVAACAVPVVSAVGHEQDTPLCDLAADVRAATPTAAARLVVPDADELHGALHAGRDRMASAIERRLERSRATVDAARARAQSGLHRTVERDRAALGALSARLRAAPLLLVERRRAMLDLAGARLAALSPRATLERGYAVVRHGATALRDATAVTAGATLEIELARGSLVGHVDEVRS